MLHDVVTFLLNFDDDKKYIGSEFKDEWKLDVFFRLNLTSFNLLWNVFVFVVLFYCHVIPTFCKILLIYLFLRISINLDLWIEFM